MSATTNHLEDETTCDDAASARPVLVGAGSVLLGDLVGRISDGRDLRTTLHGIEESSEPIAASIRTL